MMTPRAVLDERHIAVTGGWVTVFHAGPLSGEYRGSSDEYLAPGVGLPGHSCADKPPEAVPGFTVCRSADNQQWESVPDHRGQRVYSKENGQPVTITVPGPLPDTVTPQTPATPFDQWSKGKWVTDTKAQRTAAQTQARDKKAALLHQAAQTMAPLEDAADLGIATAEETARLTAWKKYRAALSRMDTKVNGDIEWPEGPE